MATQSTNTTIADSTDDFVPLEPAHPEPAKPAKSQKLTLKKRIQLAIAAVLGTTIIRMLAITFRYQVFFRDMVFRGRTIPRELGVARGPAGGPLLFALWHGSCFPILSYWRDRGMCVVTSRSTDGQALGRILNRLGFATVSGSSSRGGTRALIDLARAVRKGGDAAIAVDGPRGPEQQIKPGIVLLAKLTQRPIVPLVGTLKTYWRFQSWDRFRFPFPFTRAAILADEPIHVPADASHEVMERIRVDLEHRMRQMQIEIDEKVQPSIWKRADRRKKHA